MYLCRTGANRVVVVVVVVVSEVGIEREDFGSWKYGSTYIIIIIYNIRIICTCTSTYM